VKGYYFITDPDYSAAGLISDVNEAVDAGVELIQYRNKSAGGRVMFEEATAIKKICGKGRARLIINDRIDVAMAVDADGVHIGQEDMPYEEVRRLLGKGKIIGVTVHGVEEALEAEADGADYLGVSPVFATGTKPDAGRACGISTLRAVRRACTKPIAAIGGINLTNVDEVIGAGADLVCAISAVVAKPDVSEQIRKFQRKYGI
jgi:thiamine-phosphate pyrophosphorylase